MNSTELRLAASIGPTDLHPATRHSLGLPRELTEGRESEPMTWPRVIVIEKRPDGVFLDRLTSNGDAAGDTWHLTIDDAREQAEEEFQGMLGPWIELPRELRDEEIISFMTERSS